MCKDPHQYCHHSTTGEFREVIHGNHDLTTIALSKSKDAEPDTMCSGLWLCCTNRAYLDLDPSRPEDLAALLRLICLPMTALMKAGGFKAMQASPLPSAVPGT